MDSRTATPVAEMLRLVASLIERRDQVAHSLSLQALFRCLRYAPVAREAMCAEDAIWSHWMAHPNAQAAAVLDKATDEISRRLFDIAETRLLHLVRALPDYAEAWHKLGTLHYLLGQDDESLRDYQQSLLLEPRHFAALCTVGEIFLGRGERDAAKFIFYQVLTMHPHHDGARKRLRQLWRKRNY